MDPSNKGGLAGINLHELGIVMSISFVIGITRVLQMIRKGRQVRWFDWIIEIVVVLLAGGGTWALFEVTATPDILQLVASWIGAWGGPRTLHWLEYRMLGGMRTGETKPGDLDDRT